MAKLTQNSPTLLGEASGSIVKILDVLDGLNDEKFEDLLGSLPVVKIVTGAVKFFDKIQDPEQAVRSSVSVAVALCFGAALKSNNIDELELNDSQKKVFKTQLKKDLEEVKVDLNSFNPNSLYRNDTARAFMDRWFHTLKKDKSIKQEQLIPIIEEFLEVWLHVSWYKVVEAQKNRYSGLTDLLNRESFLLEKEIIQRELYKAELAEMYLNPTNNDPTIRLNKLYIEPNCELLEALCKDQRRERAGQGKFVSCEDHKLPPHLHTLTEHWLDNQLNTAGLYDDKFRLLLLYGMPGQGKTSFCKRLLYDLIINRQRKSKQVFFLRLRQIPSPEQLKNNPLAYIAKTIEEVYKIQTSKDELANSILILDGMDELAMSANLSMSQSDNILQALLNETRNFQNIKIVLTSRHGYLKTDRQLDGALILQLSLLNEEQQKWWIKQYLMLKPKSVLTQEAISKIDSRSPLGELINQPLLLQMVADLDELPDNSASRAKVYQQLFDQITSTPWKDERRNIPALKRIGQEKGKKWFLQSLEEMAYKMHINYQEYLASTEIVKLGPVKALIKELDPSNTLDAFKTMYISFYFREVRNEQVDKYGKENQEEFALEFIHKSFGEYLIAAFIYRKIKQLFLAPGEYGFAINENEEALEYWNKFVTPRPLSTEIIEYLITLIQLDKETKEKETLRDRLLLFAPYFFQNGFLLQSDTNIYSTSIIERAFSSFYIWFVLAEFSVASSFIHQDLPFYDQLIHNFILLSHHQTHLHLKGAYLEGANLMLANLTGAYLEGANLAGANLAGAYLGGAYLGGAKLGGAYLREAILEGTNLEGANLREAILGGAYLWGANLAGANLAGANLGRANLDSANLQRADLREAYLQRADLRGAHLEGANLKEAKLVEAILQEAKLGGADLERAKLWGVNSLTIEQLLEAKSLWKAEGLDKDLKNQLLEAKPCLFEDPNGLNACQD